MLQDATQAPAGEDGMAPEDIAAVQAAQDRMAGEDVGAS